MATGVPDYFIEDAPSYCFSHTHDPYAEDLSTFEVTAEEEAKLTRAAQRGPTSVKMALAGDEEAMADLKRLHLTKWEVRR